MINFFGKKAEAIISGNKDYRNIGGKVVFIQKKDCVLVTADIYGLPGDGFYGFHIHEGRSCSGNKADPFADTGGHYNPEGALHPDHAGDLPPLISSNGRAYLSFLTGRIKLADIIGRTIVIHSKPDDFTSQPAGNSGEKIACGKIKTTMIDKYGNRI